MSAVFEVELKFPVSDVAALREELAALNAAPQGTQCEFDTYYRHPCRDFRKTGEAFRIRRIDNVAHVTYKGPKQPGEVKTRTELEWSLAPSDAVGEKFAALLDHLGFDAVEEVRKERESFRLEDVDGWRVTITLDRVDGLGWFAEVETIADEAGIAAAQEAVRAVARRLGLASSEPRSYLQMVLEQAAGRKELG